MPTTNQISSNAFEIVYNSADTLDALMTSIKEVFVGKGYTPLNGGAVIKNTSSATRPLGSIASAGLISLGFTAPNADGFSSKPIVVEIQAFNSLSISLQLCTAESVSVNTTTGWYSYTNPPNQQFSSSALYAMMLTSVTKTAFGRILLFVSPRYAAVQHKSDAGILSDWHGVFEIAREYSGNNQALNIPTHCYISSWLMRNQFENNLLASTTGGGLTFSSFSGTYCGPIGMMRTRAGNTGQLASMATRLITSNGEVGFAAVLPAPGTNLSYVFGRRFQDVVPSAVNAWNNKNWASNIGVISDTDQSANLQINGTTVVHQTLSAPSYMGKIYGLKVITSGMGATMDQLSMPVDANSFVDAAGTPTTHYVLSNPSNASRFALPQ